MATTKSNRIMGSRTSYQRMARKVIRRSSTRRLGPKAANLAAASPEDRPAPALVASSFSIARRSSSEATATVFIPPDAEDADVPFSKNKFESPARIPAMQESCLIRFQPAYRLQVESNAGATAIGPGWMLSPRLSAGASVPVAVPGFLRALIEPSVRY